MSGPRNNKDNLDDIYSDLSDKEEQPKSKNPITSKPKPSITSTPIIMPGFLGGKVFIPPPPPSSSRPKQMNHIPSEIFQHRPQIAGFHPQQQQNQRQRKSTIFIKNIPKSCNRQQTLTTYFRTYGNIKSIKTNEQTNSAVVRFDKQQDAFRFMATKPLILNRSYIIYDTNEDFVVTAQSIAQKQKDQAGVVKPSEKQVIILKQNTQNLVADKYRCLLFLIKNKDQLSEQECNKIVKEMNKCRKIRQSESNNNQLAEILINFQNNYDWTLSYKLVTKEPIDKKKVILQFNKYGPIGSISVKLTSLTGNPTPEQSTGTIEDKLGVVRIKFLAVKSSWNISRCRREQAEKHLQNLVCSKVNLQQQKKQKELQEEAFQKLKQKQKQDQQQANQQEPGEPKQQNRQTCQAEQNLQQFKPKQQNIQEKNQEKNLITSKKEPAVEQKGKQPDQDKKNEEKECQHQK